MTTTDLIIILQDNEKGGISHKPRNISLCINGQYMPNPHISLSSTGDGICGSEIDLDIEGDWFEQQPCEDCISREAVDEYITNLLSGYLYNEERTRLEDLTAYIWELPSVQPTRPIGRWIVCDVVKFGDFVGTEKYECSKCHHRVGAFKSNFCPNCGVRMTESEDKDADSN